MSATKKILKKTLTAATKNKKAGKSKVSKTLKADKKSVGKVEIAKTSKGVIKKAKVIKAAKSPLKNTTQLRFKRLVYMALAIVLGLLIGNLLHAFVEIIYIKKMYMRGLYPQLNTYFGLSCFLPFPLELLFLLGGLGFGIWLGIWGWRVVYVEGRHWTTRK